MICFFFLFFSLSFFFFSANIVFTGSPIARFNFCLLYCVLEFNAKLTLFLHTGDRAYGLLLVKYHLTATLSLKGWTLNLQCDATMHSGQDQSFSLAQTVRKQIGSKPCFFSDSKLYN